MKTFKLLITVFFMFVFAIGYTQKVDYNGVTYLVKDNFIFINKKDVTNTLTQEQQINIKNTLSQNILADKKLKEVKKAQKKVEKALRKVEKKEAKAKKEMRRAEKARKNYLEAQKKLEKETKRHQKSLKQGKLSPEDEIKWQKKIKDLKNKIDKLRRRL